MDMADPLKSPLAGPVMDRPYQGTCWAQRSWVSGLRNVGSSQNLQLHNWAVIRTGKTVQNSQSSRSKLNEVMLNVAMSLSWSLKAIGIDERERDCIKQLNTFRHFKSIG